MSDPTNSSVIPNVQTYGYTEGASNPMQSAMMKQQQTASDQNDLNNQHGGVYKKKSKKRKFKRKSKKRKSKKRKSKKRKSKKKRKSLYKKRKGGSRIIVPQASTNGVVAAGPNDGNSAATTAAGHASQSNANAEYDDQVGQPGQVTQVAGSRKRTKKKFRYQKGCYSRVKKGGYPYQDWGCFS